MVAVGVAREPLAAGSGATTIAPLPSGGWVEIAAAAPARDRRAPTGPWVGPVPALAARVGVGMGVRRWEEEAG